MHFIYLPRARKPECLQHVGELISRSPELDKAFPDILSCSRGKRSLVVVEYDVEEGIVLGGRNVLHYGGRYGQK